MDPSSILSSRKEIMIIIAVLGIILTVMEMCCYIIFFHHLTNHNKNIAAPILNPSVIKRRNEANAVSMLGLFACWLLDVWYMVLAGILATEFEMDLVKEVSATFKDFDFVWIPLLQIMTSSLMRKEVFFRAKIV